MDGPGLASRAAPVLIAAIEALLVLPLTLRAQEAAALPVPSPEDEPALKMPASFATDSPPVPPDTSPGLMLFRASAPGPAPGEAV